MSRQSKLWKVKVRVWGSDRVFVCEGSVEEEIKGKCFIVKLACESALILYGD